MSNKLSKAIKKRIYADASKWSEMQYGHDDVNKDYLEGALHEAGLAQEAEQRIKELEQWQKEATLLLDPLLAWGQSQKDIPLGRSITKEILRRAKLYTEAEQRADRYEKALNWVKQYALNCQNNRTISNPLVIYSTIDKALTPKPAIDDTANG